MRRLSIAWLLSLLLVFAQQGAVLHELGHLSHSEPAGATVVQADPHALGGTFCPSCEGFAQLAHPAAAGIPAVAVCPSGCLPTADRHYVVVARNSPTPRNRGPPQA